MSGESAEMDDRSAYVVPHIWRVALLSCLALLSGCQLLSTKQTSLQQPVATHAFSFDPERDDVVLVTDAAVVEAIVDGRLTLARALELRLARLYGAPESIAHARRWLVDGT